MWTFITSCYKLLSSYLYFNKHIDLSSWGLESVHFLSSGLFLFWILIFILSFLWPQIRDNHIFVIILISTEDSGVTSDLKEYQETGSGFLTPSWQKQLFERHEAHLLNKQQREKNTGGSMVWLLRAPPLLLAWRMSHPAARRTNPEQLLLLQTTAGRHTPAPNYRHRAQWFASLR